MQMANQFSALIKRVLVLHIGIGLTHIQDYLNWACMRQMLRSAKPERREKYLLCLCASTGIDFVRPRKK
jgi:hypothetical protein